MVGEDDDLQDGLVITLKSVTELLKSLKQRKQWSATPRICPVLSDVGKHDGR